MVFGCKKKLDDLAQAKDIKGILHCHSTYSDGRHSLADMAAYVKSQGYQYLGITDHSQSAFYAGGLSIQKVKEQHEEIASLNKKLAPFVIFHGIESDILNDGSLDYDPNTLALFDFVIASLHAPLPRTQAEATGRLLKAIENPHTSILGHLTGRLLLERQAYPVDVARVIEACGKSGVAIELNANMFRMDLDWTWLPYAQKHHVHIAITPDAHHKEGTHATTEGINFARKGHLNKTMTLNAMDTETLRLFFKNQKKRVKQN